MECIRRKLFHKICSLLLFMAAVLLMTSASFAASNPTTTVNELYTEVSESKVNVLDVSRNHYLFLPSEADSSNVFLKTDKEGCTVRFRINGAEYETIDLNQLSATNGKYQVNAVIKDEQDKTVSSISLYIMQGSGIGSLYYVTDDKDTYGRSWVDAVKGNASSGSAVVTDETGKIINSTAKERVVEDFHGRGFSSWQDPKKGYQIKFDKKVSLVEGTAKAKKWILLAQYKDPLHMNDKIMKDISYMVSDGRYSPRETWVNFYYDGEYRGVYLISEKNEIKSGRIEITDMEDYYEDQDEDYGETTNLKTAKNKYGYSYQYQDGLEDPEELGGYLFEMNYTQWDENNGFEFKSSNTKRAANLKSPDLGGQRAIEYISEYFQEFCDAAASSSGKNESTGLYFYDYCDIDSLVDAYLIQCISSEFDSFFKSQFFYKEKGEKMVAGPVWDMDLSFGTGWYSQTTPESDEIAGKVLAGDLLKIPVFKKLVKERYKEVYSGILGSLCGDGDEITSFRDSYDVIKDDLTMEYVIWPERYKVGGGSSKWSSRDSYETIVNYRVDWLSRHKAYLDKYFDAMNIPENTVHQFADPVPYTETTHARICEYHSNQVITENCDLVKVSNGDGTYTVTCDICGRKDVKDCEYDVVASNDDGTHTKTCSDFDETVTENCTFDIVRDNGNGTHSKTCSICGYTVTENHAWGDVTVVTPATEEKAGAGTHECKVCGKSESVAIPQLPSSLKGNTSNVNTPLDENASLNVKTKITKLKAGKGSVTVNWKKASAKKKKKISGYQIQYSATKDFKDAVTVKAGKSKKSKTIKSLESNTRYYVRMRAVKGSAYGKWSAVKKISTK